MAPHPPARPTPPRVALRGPQSDMKTGLGGINKETCAGGAAGCPLALAKQFQRYATPSLRRCHGPPTFGLGGAGGPCSGPSPGGTLPLPLPEGTPAAEHHRKRREKGGRGLRPPNVWTSKPQDSPGVPCLVQLTQKQGPPSKPNISRRPPLTRQNSVGMRNAGRRCRSSQRHTCTKPLLSASSAIASSDSSSDSSSC